MRVPRPPSGSPPTFSGDDMGQVVQRLHSAVGFEQEITLTPWECWLLLRTMARLEHNSRRSS